jgi:hypothetical protein
MTGSLFTVGRLAGSRRSSALIVTLVILALVTILVVSLASMIGSERITTHESFENQRARELAGIAVDEVVATLHDNIPTNTIWAVAPGQLTYLTNGTYNTVLLCSGVASGVTSGTGQVDLNAPVLGSSPTVYPIAPTNSEYPTAPQMPVAWVDVLQDGTIIRNGQANTATKNNPIVGRYAYWVDTETSKANINTAGRGQTTYTFNNSFSSGNDLQNLTASPSRLDLSQLDGGITYQQSDATFHYTYGGYWLPDPGSGDMITAAAPNSTTNVPVFPEGEHRFNDIADWAQMPSTDVITGTVISPITNTTQIEQNKFYLTTHSRTPDLTPWGYNKLWLETADENVTPTGLSLADMGNRLNGRGVPVYPPSTAIASTNYPMNQTAPTAAEPRYYYTPYVTNSNPPSDLVAISHYDSTGSMRNTANFVNNMMVQLNRTDWPGFTGKSFVQKYGQKECEDLAYNILCMYDMTVRGIYTAPEIDWDGWDSRNFWADMDGVYGGRNFFGLDRAGQDINGSTTAYSQIDGTNRMFCPVGEWPYFNEISVEFQAPPQATTTGYVPPVGAPYVLFATNQEPFAGSVTPLTGDGSFYTKYADRPGFAGTLSSADTNAGGCNIAITPFAQVVYPPGFRNPFYSGFSSGGGGASHWAMCDISVYATGTWNGSAVTYGAISGNGSQKVLGARTASTCPYYWGPMDNFLSTNGSPPAYGVYANPGTNSPWMYGNSDTGMGAGDDPLLEIDNTNSPQTIRFCGTYWDGAQSIYIGPFTFGSTITDLQFRARFVHVRPDNCWMPVEIAPLAYNFPSSFPFNTGSMGFTSATGSAEIETFQNSVGVNQGPNGQPYSPVFVFEVKNFKISSSNFQDVTYEAKDPRAFRYTNDWTMRSDQMGITPVPQSYTETYTDPITGVTGDSSKFAWPNLGMSYYNSSYEDWYVGPSGGSAGNDRRHIQYANNIQGLPGVGFLSFLPLNLESSQGTNTSPTGGSGTGNVPGSPIPWRTLSLEANQKANTFIPDWILLEAFGVAYDQTFCSHTEGKINVNTSLGAAFPASTSIAPRTKPLAALIAPSTYPSAAYDLATMGAGTLTGITNSIAQGPGTTYGSNLPTNIFIYPGQLCELNLQQNSSATNQLQRESLMRTLLGTLTTQSSDFLVHVVAQSVKQVNFNTTVNPSTDLQVTSEQRMSALVSRLPNLGPDNIPDSGWNNVSSTFSPTLADEPTTNGATVPVTSVTTSGLTSTNWVTSAPSFRYKVSDIQYSTSE